MFAVPSARYGRVALGLLSLVLVGTLSQRATASAAEWSTTEDEELLPGWETTQRLFDTYRKVPLAQVAVAYASKQCQWVDADECRKRLDTWRATGGVHPLVAQMLDRELADLARSRGDTGLAAKLSSGLGYLTRWDYAVVGGAGEALADPVTGWVVPSAFFRPPGASALELETRVSAAEETRIALRLTGAWLAEACLNDECFALPVLEGSLWDDHVLPVTLRKGENRLVVRFLAEGTGLRFVARLTHLSGGALPLEYGAGGVLVRPLGKVGKRETNVVAGPLGLLSNDETPELLLLRCMVTRSAAVRGGVSPQELLQSRTPKDATEWDLALACSQQTDVHQELLAKLVALNGNTFLSDLHSLAQHLYLSEYFQTLEGAARLRRQLLESSRALDAALRGQAVELVAEALGRCGLDMAQLPFLASLNVTWAKGVPRLVLALAEAHLADGNREDAGKALWPFAARFPGQPEVVMPLVDGASPRPLDARALSAIRRLAALRPLVPGHRLALMTALLRMGQTDEARKVLSQAMAEFPHQPSFQREWASLCIEAGDFDGAVASLKTLLSLHPTDTWARALLTRLGGDQEENPFRDLTADSIRALAEQLPDAPSSRMVGLLDRTMIRLQPNGASTFWRLQAFLVVQVEESQPVTLSYMVENQGQVGRLERAQILHTDGTFTSLVEVAQPLLDDAQYNMFYDVTNNVVEFSDLEAGDILVFGYRVDSLPSVLETPFAEIIWLSDLIPKWNVRVDVAVPKGTELYSDVSTPDSTLRYQQAFFDKNGESFHSYDFKYLPRVPSERYSPGWFESATLVHVSRYEKAKEFGQWYSGVLGKATSTDRAMKDLVERLRSSTSDRKALIEELCRFVADQIRYVGLELGVHRLRPHSPTDVLRHGFGDCKDKSLLLVSLLSLAGVEAHVVAIATGNRGTAPTSIISSALFNHAIVYIPELDVYFDPTDIYLGLGSLPWAVMGQPGVVIQGKESRLVRTPELERGFSELTVSLRLSAPAAPGEAVPLSGTLTFAGQNARRILPVMDDEGNWPTEMKEYLSGLFPVAEVVAWEATTQEGARPALVVKFDALWSPLRDSGQSVMQSVSGAVTTVTEPSRQLPVVLGFPYKLSYRVSWPAGTLKLIGLRPQSEESPEVSFQVAEAASEGEEGFSLVFEQKSHRISVDRVGEWRDLVVRFREALSPLELDVHAK